MPQPSAPTLARRAAISSLAVFGSRLLGLVREQVFAFCFGASREYDAFLTAFRIPNLLRDLLAEGALSSAFVAVFSRELAARGAARAYAVANRVMVALAALLLALVALGIFVSPALVRAMAIGFDADKAALTVTLTRAMFAFIVFVAMAAIAMGMLNAQGYFGLPQSASSFFNIVSVAVGLAAAALMQPEYMARVLSHAPGAAALPAGAGGRAMMGMAIGTLMGGLVQWGVQLPLLWRLGWRPWPRVAWRDPAFVDVMRLLGPAVIGAAAVQLSVFINSNFASTLGDRPISWLAYSFRLLQFPIGLFGVAVMSASLPALSRLAQQNDERGFAQTLTESLQLVLFFTVPAAFGLVVCGESIVRLLFEHGRFGPSDTRACAAAVSAYALGLPGYSALKIVQPAFVARGDARTPMLVTLCGVALSVGCNALFLFVWHWGHVGLALSTSLLATGSTAALLAVLAQRMPLHGSRALATQASRIVLAAAVSALAGVGVVRLASGAGAPSMRVAALQLALGGGAMAMVYLAVAQRLQVATVQTAMAVLGRRLGRPTRASKR